MSVERILVVDDEIEMRELLSEFLEDEGYAVVQASEGAEALRVLEQVDCDMVISDIRMNGMDGMDLLRSVHKRHPHIPMLMMTAFGSIDTAIEAMKLGAHHFVTKPFKLDDVLVMVRRALEDLAMRAENKRLRKEVNRRYSFGNIIGRSKPMADLFELVELVAAGHSNVLVLGESGTGKELVARAIHYNGPRANKPFIPINVTAIPEGLLESELFGHTRGSFTGAVANKKGLFVEADKGTLFLDEIGDMPATLQAKLLRVLQDRRVRPVGGNQDTEIDVRIITATHRNLEDEVKEGRFREDLYYRLSVIPVGLPPLRERRDDIPLLTTHFLERFAQEQGSEIKALAPEAMEALQRYGWPGNVRELENIMERVTVLTRSERVELADLPGHVRGEVVPGASHALDDLPALDGMTDTGRALAGTLTLTATMPALELAFDAAKYGAPSERPHVELTAPTLRWPDLAPSGKHVLVARASCAPHTLRDGQWDASSRDRFADSVTREIGYHARGFANRVLHRVTIVPPDIAGSLNCTEGAASHGEMMLDQILFMRPVAGWGDHAMPVAGLFLCGSGAHPGPGISGGAGWLAARRALTRTRER